MDAVDGGSLALLLFADSTNKINATLLISTCLSSGTSINSCGGAAD